MVSLLVSKTSYVGSNPAAPAPLYDDDAEIKTRQQLFKRQTFNLMSYNESCICLTIPIGRGSWLKPNSVWVRIPGQVLIDPIIYI